MAESRVTSITAEVLATPVSQARVPSIAAQILATASCFHGTVLGPAHARGARLHDLLNRIVLDAPARCEDHDLADQAQRNDLDAQHDHQHAEDQRRPVS